MDELTEFQRKRLLSLAPEDRWMKFPSKVDESGALVPDFPIGMEPKCYASEETKDKKYFYVVILPSPDYVPCEKEQVNQSQLESK